MRNFHKYTTSQEQLPKMHKFWWETSKIAKNYVRNFQNVKHPIRNFQKCTEKIPCTRCFWYMFSAFSFQLTVYIFWHEVKLMTCWLQI
jgi:hypothetical protein